VDAKRWWRGCQEVVAWMPSQAQLDTTAAAAAAAAAAAVAAVVRYYGGQVLWGSCSQQAVPVCVRTPAGAHLQQHEQQQHVGRRQGRGPAGAAASQRGLVGPLYVAQVPGHCQGLGRGHAQAGQQLAQQRVAGAVAGVVMAAGVQQGEGQQPLLLGGQACKGAGRWA
jgi:hypothetical protein